MKSFAEFNEFVRNGLQSLEFMPENNTTVPSEPAPEPEPVIEPAKIRTIVELLHSEKLVELSLVRIVELLDSLDRTRHSLKTPFSAEMEALALQFHQLTGLLLDLLDLHGLVEVEAYRLPFDPEMMERVGFITASQMHLSSAESLVSGLVAVVHRRAFREHASGNLWRKAQVTVFQ